MAPHTIALQPTCTCTPPEGRDEKGRIACHRCGKAYLYVITVPLRTPVPPPTE